mmetsp:Transcript_7233/g.17609  ORF Transcript_7233/g.17609 Transcript_7233/m.17609 type:complete len:102 (-) Transcript_7233:135-440(-)
MWYIATWCIHPYLVLTYITALHRDQPACSYRIPFSLSVFAQSAVSCHDAVRGGWVAVGWCCVVLCCVYRLPARMCVHLSDIHCWSLFGVPYYREGQREGLG